MRAIGRNRWRLGLLAVLLAPVPADAAGDDASGLTAVAVARLEAVSASRVEGLSPFDILLRNLSRYFTTYPVTTDSDALAEVLGLAEELSRRYAWGLLRIAAAELPPGGPVALSAERLQRVATRALPRRPTPHGETLFFPEHPEAAQTVLERWDLEAFAATGFGWQTLLSLSELLAQTPLPRVEPAAAEVLAAEAATVALLVLRRAGRRAARERAPLLSGEQVRLEAARLERLIGRAAAGAPPEPAVISEGAEPPPSGPFTDVTAAAGIRFRHVSSDWLARWRRFGPLAPSFGGGGVAASDLDGDGWPDLVICGGHGCRAYRNLGDGGFEEVTERLGIGAPCEARMPLAVDLDNDGWQELFVSCVRDPVRLYRGLPDGGLDEVTARAGLGGEGLISGPAVAVDVDGDALLDLYVGSFGDYLAGESPFQRGDNKNGQPDRLYRNLGGLRFEDVSAATGVGNTGWAQAVSHADVDGDGDQDIYVANDFGRNDLLLNRGDGTFESAGAVTGADDPFHGMNVAFADLNGDRLPDIYVTNIWSLDPRRLELIETSTLLMSRPSAEGPRFEPLADAELAAIDTGWSWGAQFLDFDNDADDDLFIVNGFTDYWTTTQQRAHPDRPGERYWINNGREPNLLLVNRDGVPNQRQPSGAELADANSRGLALLDLDLDGDLDLAITTFHGEARLFRNDAGGGNRWLAVALEGSPAAGSSRDAIGAVLLAEVAGRRMPIWRQVSGGEGYLSMSSRTLGIGLGSAATAGLEVRWPGGARQRFERLPTDHRLRIVQRQAPRAGR